MIPFSILVILFSITITLVPFVYQFIFWKQQKKVILLKKLLNKSFPDVNEIFELLTKFRSTIHLKIFLEIYNNELSGCKSVEPIFQQLANDISIKFSSTEWNRIEYLWKKTGIIK